MATTAVMWRAQNGGQDVDEFDVDLTLCLDCDGRNERGLSTSCTCEVCWFCDGKTRHPVVFDNHSACAGCAVEAV